MHIGDKKSVQSLFANLYLMLMKKKIKSCFKIVPMLFDAFVP
jgi:hypothetical protein